MGCPRRKYWSGLPFPSLGDRPDPGVELASCALQVDSLPLSHQGSPHSCCCKWQNFILFYGWAVFISLGFPSGSVVKNPPANGEDVDWPLGQEYPLVKEMATHSNILAWEIPWTEEPGGLQSMGSRVKHDLVTKQQQYSIACIFHIFFTHSSVDEHRLLPYLGYCKQCCYEYGGILLKDKFKFKTVWRINRKSESSSIFR